MILLESYLQLVKSEILPINKDIRKFLIRKPGRGNSGIYSISILTSPYPAWIDKRGKEKKQNPRLQVSSVDEYIEIMNNLNLKKPAQIDFNVSKNINLGV